MPRDVCGRAFAPAVLLALSAGLVFAPAVSADDAPPVPPAPGPVVEVQAAVPVHGGDPAAMACGQFAQALDYAATNYSDFADSVAFGDTRLDFGDPTVQSNNRVGRTALRQAAGATLEAAGTPGLNPAIADPMRSWSLHATKLLLLMGIRSDSARIDNAVVQVNDDTYNVQMACAQAGTRA